LFSDTVPVGRLPHRFAPSDYIGPDGGRWRVAREHARVGVMAMKDLISLAAVIVGMLIVLVAN
jgi:hypothetical protein